MPEDFLNIIIPLGAVVVFIAAFIYVKITNPHNQKIETRTTIVDLL